MARKFPEWRSLMITMAASEFAGAERRLAWGLVVTFQLSPSRQAMKICERARLTPFAP